MLNTGFPLLSTLIFFPLLAAVILFFLRSDTTVRVFTLVVSIIECALTLPLIVGFDTTTAQFQMVEKASWIDTWNIYY